MSIREFAENANATLSRVPPDQWALWFVELRMQFSRCYPHGLFSTSHGIDFFDNIILGPEAWTEKGEYGDNFRKMFKEHP